MSISGLLGISYKLSRSKNRIIDMPVKHFINVYFDSFYLNRRKHLWAGSLIRLFFKSARQFKQRKCPYVLIFLYFHRQKSFWTANNSISLFVSNIFLLYLCYCFLFNKFEKKWLSYIAYIDINIVLLLEILRNICTSMIWLNILLLRKIYLSLSQN